MARTLMKGCEAIAEAAVRAGCRFFAGYPITPQNEIPEYFARSSTWDCLNPRNSIALNILPRTLAVS